MNIINMNSPIDNTWIQKNNTTIQSNSNPLDLQKNFLSLLIAQIKNQDPTDPMKNTELTSQLAQINTAGGIERLNNTVRSFSNQINKNQNLQLSSLIGRRVMIPNNQIVHTKDTETKFGIELIGHASSVQITIKDKNNKIVHVKKVENLEPGIYNFSWNGKDLDNNSVITEKYNISVEAKNQENDVPVQSLSIALVNSIITSFDEPIIDLGTAGNITLSQIREILQ